MSDVRWRVVLPSGRTVEIGESRDLCRDLHVCPECRSELVDLVEWEDVGAPAWRVVLRCPECETCRQGVLSEAPVDALVGELRRGRDALARDYELMWRANMSAEIDRFVTALHADGLLPEDF
jgi:hypothetical protein